MLREGRCEALASPEEGSIEQILRNLIDELYVMTDESCPVKSAQELVRLVMCWRPSTKTVAALHYVTSAVEILKSFLTFSAEACEALVCEYATKFDPIFVVWQADPSGSEKAQPQHHSIRMAVEQSDDVMLKTILNALEVAARSSNCLRNNAVVVVGADGDADERILEAYSGSRLQWWWCSCSVSSIRGD